MSELEDDEVSRVFDVPTEIELSAEQRARVVAGRYEIVEQIGAGAMGQVFRVQHLRLGKAFALKLMRAEHSLDKQAEQLFHREAQLASQLSHPAIVAMVDFGNDPDWGWFIVMEYLEGEPLSKHIERLRQLPIAAACEVAAQLADALVHSHGKRVIHADLKSENVLCLVAGDDEGANPWQVKLLDFGTAHLEETVSGSTDRISGTPEYMAPERITGGEPQASSDIYALGIILYEMLCGTPPFVGGEPRQILERHLVETRESVGARRGEVLDERLDAIIDTALQKDPAVRYPTAQAMLDDLREYLEVLGVRQRAGMLPSLMTRTDARADASAAAFDAMGVPAAGLRRDGTIVIANRAFARLLRVEDLATLEGHDIMQTMLAELVPDLYDDLRVVALNGKVIRRDLMLPRPEKFLRARYILAPATGACGHCMLVVHSLQ
ncbi:MAG: serine/threonine protein kinase [Deltaproteobacteria bacterium]|nr:serine/threonine protein kinase [Deltaproteobacteria bacterium]